MNEPLKSLFNPSPHTTMKTAVQIALAATIWLLLGVPLWMYTIEVDRAQLNFDELERYELLASQPVITAIRVAASDPQIPDIAPATQLVLNRILETRGSQYRFKVDNQCTELAELCINPKLGEHDVIELHPGKKELEITYKNTTLENARVPEIIGLLLLDHVYKNEIFPNQKPPREEVTVQYSPQYHLTFSLFSERGNKLDWDIGAALKEGLGRLLGEIDETVASLTIDTQTALYAEIDNVPCDDAGIRILEQSQLSAFVDFAEWKLASSLPYPTLNFVLYVPETPLEIPHISNHLSDKQPQFIVPQWGGVLIAQPQGPNHRFTIEELRPVLDTFARQLLALLGVRESVDQDKVSNAPTHIKLAHLSRSYALKGLKGAAASLGSLRRLAAGMKHIAIPQEVAVLAKEAMNEIDAAIAHLENSRHVEAVSCAKRAYMAADKAFFNKHMVAQAYFPDEHKVAVYMPLIGPLFVVVLSGWMRQRKSKKMKDAKQGDSNGTNSKDTQIKLESNMCEKTPLSTNNEAHI